MGVVCRRPVHHSTDDITPGELPDGDPVLPPFPAPQPRLGPSHGTPHGVSGVDHHDLGTLGTWHLITRVLITRVTGGRVLRRLLILLLLLLRVLWLLILWRLLRLLHLKGSRIGRVGERRCRGRRWETAGNGSG